MIKPILPFMAFLLIAMYSSLGQERKQLSFHPIKHASLVITYGELIIYVDPANEFEAFSKFRAPDLVLFTHTHGDHFHKESMDRLKAEHTRVIGNQLAIEQLGYGTILQNGDETIFETIKIEAIAAYNNTEERMRFHPKGVGNGYVLTLGNERVYISGDTEDISEMRALKHIDHAFVCMNLPYTMTPEQAADAVIEFQPRNVYPYHYRQSGGFANVDSFTQTVKQQGKSTVLLLNWYPD